MRPAFYWKFPAELHSLVICFYTVKCKEITLFQKYVLGFVFDARDQVLLMTKDHPTAQVGKLNGIGGKILDDEGTAAAMAREGAEEVYSENPFHWLLAGEFGGAGWIVHVFTAVYQLPVEAKEKEPVDWYSIHRLPVNCMYNLKYLVPLCYDAAIRKGGTTYFKVSEN